MDNNFNSSDSLNNPNSMTNISDFQDSNHLNSDVCSLNSVDVMTNSTNVLDSPGNISGNLVSNYMSEQQDFSSPLNQQGVFEGAENSYYQEQILPDSFELASNHYMTMDVKPHVSQMLYDDQVEYTQTENNLNNGLSDQIDSFQSHENLDPNHLNTIVIDNPSDNPITSNDYSYDLGNIGNHEHHSLSATNQLEVMNSHDNCPYTTMNNNGFVYKHISGDSGGEYVGKVNGRSVYNTSNYYLGYAGTDGKVYDNHDHCVGWVHGCHVYNKAGIEVYETTRGVVGAAAYLLCVYYGGVN